jgi:SHS2 domain-containing protein
MKRFEFLEHTADIGLVAYGNSLAEAFTNAACGLFSIIVDLDSVREFECRQVEIGGEDAEGLLFEWLNRLIYLFDVEMILMKRFVVMDFNDYSMKVKCYGERYNPTQHCLKTGVKSVTYHRLKVDRGKKQVRVIFDV